MARQEGRSFMRRLSATSNQSQAGFTLIELLIAMSLIAIVLSVFITSLLSMLDVSSRTQAQLELNGDNQVALDIIERDVRLANAYGTTLPAPFVDQYGPTATNDGWTGTWSYKGTSPGSPTKVLILQQRATVGNPYASNRQPIFIKGFVANPYLPTDATLSCSTGGSGAQYANHKLPYYVILFVRDGTLYRRTAVDTTTQLCNGPQRQKQSCPREDATPYAACQAYDEILAHHVTGFRVDYHQQLDVPTPTFEQLDVYNSNDPKILDAVDNITVTLTTKKPAFGKTVESKLTLRASRIN